MKPEEKFTCILLKRHGLIPPYDIKALVSLYTKVSFLLNFAVVSQSFLPVKMGQTVRLSQKVSDQKT